MDNIGETMSYNFGEICEHDKLKRQCDYCWHAWELQKQNELISSLQKDLQVFKQQSSYTISNISLRDYMAAKAMQGILAGGADFEKWEHLAIDCYAISDAMIKQSHNKG